MADLNYCPFHGGAPVKVEELVLSQIEHIKPGTSCLGDKSVSRTVAARGEDLVRRFVAVSLEITHRKLRSCLKLFNRSCLYKRVVLPMRWSLLDVSDALYLSLSLYRHDRKPPRPPARPP